MADRKPCRAARSWWRGVEEGPHPLGKDRRSSCSECPRRPELESASRPAGESQQYKMRRGPPIPVTGLIPYVAPSGPAWRMVAQTEPSAGTWCSRPWGTPRGQYADLVGSGGTTNELREEGRRLQAAPRSASGAPRPGRRPSRSTEPGPQTVHRLGRPCRWPNRL